ncbi:MAG: hypothetical protein AABZ78_12785 [Chloroflexota bacterium]
MNPNNPADTSWELFKESTEKLERNISRSNAANVNATDLRDEAKQVAQLFFRQCAYSLSKLEIEGELLSGLNDLMKELLKLSNRPNKKSSYLSVLKRLSKLIDEITVEREIRFSNFIASQDTSNLLLDSERLIYDTLYKIIPAAAVSYMQAIIDLSDKNRLSYRGVANELREALRETLDHLAPDKNVISQPNFKLEKDKKTPTMKQKARYILRARELPENATRSPEDAVEVVENINERIASFARSTYERSSISAHVASERTEVLRMKGYVNVVLTELLALQI